MRKGLGERTCSLCVLDRSLLRSAPMRLIVVLFVIVPACSSDSLFGVVAIGEHARVSMISRGAAGGNVYENRPSIDSATGQFEVLTCRGRFTACDTLAHTLGTVEPVFLTRLFREAQQRQFVDLATEYAYPGEFKPPDGGSTTLVVVVGERRKEIRWDKYATLPTALTDFTYLLRNFTDSSPACDRPRKR